MSHVQTTPNSGDLKQILLPAVFFKAVLQRFSGILDIESDHVTKLIYFKNGNVVFVESNDREETFGHFLMRKKIIDPKTLDESLKELANQIDLRLGEILLKKGLMNPNSVMEQLNAHQEEKLLNAFSFKKGKYRLIENLEWPEYVTPFPLRTLNVFFTAVEKFISVDEIAEHTYLHAEAKIQLNHQPDREIPLPPFATRLINSISREWVPADVVAAKLSMPVAKVLTYLYTFSLADWITVENVGKKEVLSDHSNPEKKPESKIVKETRTEEQAIVEKVEATDAFTQRVDIEYQKIEGLNFYQLFGVGPSFTLQQLQINFFQIIAEYKRYETSPKGREIVEWIKTAYDVLKDPKLRVMYDYRFGFRKKSSNMEAAEKSFYRAVRLLENSDVENAKDILEQINKKVTDSTYRAYMALVLFQESPQKNSSDISKFLEEAFKIYPADPFAHYIAGNVELFRKRNEKAQGHFRSALQVFPGYTDAANALSQVKVEAVKEKRQQEDEKKKGKTGFFDLSVGGFSFGKKD